MEASRPSVSQTSQRKQHRLIDLEFKRSVGDISSLKYKRLTIHNQLNNIGYEQSKTSIPALFENPDDYFLNFLGNDVIGMEVDPTYSKRLLAISKFYCVAIYDISPGVDIFNLLVRKTIPYEIMGYVSPPNSVHWLWDCSVFSVCAEDCVQFWDTETCSVIKSLKLPTKVMTHVIAAKKCSLNKYMAATGKIGHIYIIDRYGTVVMTMTPAEKHRIRAIHWHPTNELFFVTGNENGNIYLWDTRNEKDFVFKFVQDASFPKISSHPRPVVGVRFYNDGNSIISVDNKGGIKTWEASSGHMYHQNYEPVLLTDINEENNVKEYQFAVTDSLKQDIAFLPSKNGLKIIDIDTGENLPNSQDVSIPVSCATYDPRKFCVYGGSGDAVKMWSSRNKLSQH